jgi:hypothetical protein
MALTAVMSGRDLSGESAKKAFRLIVVSFFALSLSSPTIRTRIIQGRTPSTRP